MTLSYIVNEPSTIKKSGELTEIQLNPKTEQYGISLEHGHAHLLSLWALQTTLYYIVNEPSAMQNDRELTEIQDRLMVSTCHIHYMFLGPLLGYYGAHYSVRHHRTHLLH